MNRTFTGIYLSSMLTKSIHGQRHSVVSPFSLSLIFPVITHHRFSSWIFTRFILTIALKTIALDITTHDDFPPIQICRRKGKYEIII